MELVIREKIGENPVVNRSEGLVGLVTYVDIFTSFCTNYRKNNQFKGRMTNKDAKKGMVRELMIGFPVTLKPDRL